MDELSGEEKTWRVTGGDGIRDEVNWVRGVGLRGWLVKEGVVDVIGTVRIEVGGESKVETSEGCSC